MRSAILLCAAVLAGCAAQPDTAPSPWGADKQASVAGTDLQLNSNIWINMMPSATEDTDYAVNGALYITTDEALPADLSVAQVMVRQGENSVLLGEADFELRTHTEQQWEVAFSAGMRLDTDNQVDVAVAVEYQGKQTWLVERNLDVDVAY